MTVLFVRLWARAHRTFQDAGHPVDPRITSGHTPLHIAAQMGNVEVCTDFPRQNAAAKLSLNPFWGVHMAMRRMLRHIVMSC
jgi:hypothetical protein